MLLSLSVKDKDKFHLYLITTHRTCQGGKAVEETKTLSDAAKQERRDYARRWRANNRDKVKEINRRYWEKRAKEASVDVKEDNH